MAIDYVGGTSGSRNGNSNATTTQSLTALTGGIASAPAQNDLVIVVCVVGSQGRNNAQAISGYTTLGTQLNPNTQTYDTSLQVSWKVMTATPDTQITIPAQGNVADGQAWAVMVFRGVNTTTPFDVTSVSASGTGTGRFDAAAITPTTAGSWIVIAGGGAAATGAAYTAPTDFATDWISPSAGADTNDAMAAMGYYTGWTTGQYNPAAVTGGTTNAVDSWASWTMALRPASSTTDKAVTFTGTGSASLTRVLSLSRSSTFTGTGTSSLAKTHGLSYSAAITAVGTLLLEKGKQYSQDKTFSATATAELLKASSFARALTYSGVGTQALTKLGEFSESNAYAATGTSALVRLIGKGLEFAGTGTVQTSKQIELPRSFSATGTVEESDLYIVPENLSYSAVGSLALVLEATFGGVATRIKRTVAFLFGSINRYLARKD